jgi:hypothetical protein
MYHQLHGAGLFGVKARSDNSAVPGHWDAAFGRRHTSTFRARSEIEVKTIDEQTRPGSVRILAQYTPGNVSYKQF